MKRVGPSASPSAAPRAVVVLPQWPWPCRSGFQRRCVQVIDAMDALGWELVLACTGRVPDDVLSQAEASASLPPAGARVVRYVPSRVDRRVRNALRSWYARRGEDVPPGSLVDTPPGMRRWFRRVVADAAPDVVVVHHVRWAPLVARRRRARAVMDMTDLYTLNRALWRPLEAALGTRPYSVDAVASGVLEPAFLDDKSFAASAREYKLYERFDLTLAIEPSEAEAVRANTRRTRAVYEPLTMAPVDIAKTYDGPAVLPLGRNPFNMQGYLWFVREVLPHVLAAVPDFELHITGDGGDDLVPVPGVVQRGQVADLSALYASARMALCPVFAGTGQPVKVIEAMAHALPVVVVPRAAQRSGVRDGVDGLVSGDGLGFARHVIALWQDEAMCRRLGTAARASAADAHARSGLPALLGSVVVERAALGTRGAAQTLPLPGRSPDLVTVVVPVKDGGASLGHQLEALVAQRYHGPWEVVVVDNGSRDDSAAVARSFADRLPGLRLLPATERQSVSHARNVGVRAAAGEFVVICDADDVVAAGWLAALAGAAQRGHIVGGRLDDSSNDPVHIRWRGPLPTDRLMTFERSLPFAAGCNFGVWKHIFDELDGWDEGFVGGSEDIDFCWRAQQRGYTIGYEPEAVVRYHYRTTLRGLSRQYYRAGRTEAQLIERFRPTLVDWPSRLQTIRSLYRLARRAPGQLRRPDLRGLWVRDVAHRAGRASGRVSLLRPSVRAWVQRPA